MSLNSNSLEYRLIEAWKKHHTSNIFISRKKDILGLDITGVTGMPLAYNKLLHHFNLASVNYLVRKIGSLSGKYVLDIGCGAGRWSRYMSDRGAKVTGIDISDELLNNNKITMPEIEFVNMSACKMKFENGKFDLVISVTVLQHMPYGIQEEAIKEICRVLKVGGYALIVEGTREDEDKIYKHSFPHSTRGWIKKFQDGNCVLMYHLKNTNPFLINLYFEFRDKILCLFKNKIDGISSETSDALDTSSYDKIMNDKIKGEGYKKLLFLRKVFRICNYFIIYLLSKISYPIEYLNMYIFRYYPTSDGAFLFKKAGK